MPVCSGVQVFDLRMLRMVSPIPFSPPHGPRPMFTRFFPQYTSTAVIGGASGRFRIYDLAGVEALPLAFFNVGLPGPVGCRDQAL